MKTYIGISKKKCKDDYKTELSVFDALSKYKISCFDAADILVDKFGFDTSDAHKTVLDYMYSIFYDEQMNILK
jgi:hypothetical protein